MDNLNEFETIDDLEELNDETEMFGETGANLNDQEEKMQVESEDIMPTEENVTSSEYSVREQQVEAIPEEVKPQTLPNEIGRVKDIGADGVIIKVTSNLAFEKNLIDHHVVFETSSGSKIVGTLVNINSEVGT